jgi:hypothetical protein
MHFIALLKHEDNVAENNRQTQLVIKRENATGRAETGGGLQSQTA